MDAEASASPEVPVSGGRDDEKTYNTPAYVRTMDTYVKNIY